MRLVTWNVNSIRARIDAVVSWLDRHAPDVVCLQETKCSDATFGEVAGAFASRGHEVVHHGRDHDNGVAIASRVGLDRVRIGFDDPPDERFDEARLVRAVCAGIDVSCVYVPNGRRAHDPHWHFKLAWLAALRAELDVGRPSIVAGDVNVQRSDVDVYDPRRCRNRNHATPEERAELAALLDLGLVDVVRERHPGPGVYTWWNHAAGQFERNRGMRIDLVLCSHDVAGRVADAWIDTDERGRPRSSDHAPVVVDLRDP